MSRSLSLARRMAMVLLLMLVAAPFGVAQTQAPPKLTPMTVYKSPTCGCCAKWVEHMRANGFAVTVNETPDVAPIKDKQGVPAELRSCHTALVGGYAIEGHVPADVIKKLLRERPNAVGLAVPGMPMGSPGMEGASKDSYNVMLFDKAGKATIYASR
jgi:hypothetical protein